MDANWNWDPRKIAISRKGYAFVGDMTNTVRVIEFDRSAVTSRIESLPDAAARLPTQFRLNSEVNKLSLVTTSGNTIHYVMTYTSDASATVALTDPNCEPGFIRDLGVCERCREGFTLRGGNTCQACSDNSCYHCGTDRPDHCTKCRDNASWGTIKCDCNENFYLETATGICRTCHNSCAHCTGPANNQCVSCNHTNNAYLSAANTCSCIDTYYLDTAPPELCRPCGTACRTCSGPANNQCLTCFDGSAPVGGVCTCPGGTTWSTTQRRCENTGCPVRCLTCSGSACLTCN